MVLSRLFLAGERIHLQRRGHLRLFRSFSSSSSSSTTSSTRVTAKAPPLKKSEVAREQRRAAVEACVRSYMEQHPGVFPKTKQVQNMVGGSWYILKDILSDLREKILGNSESQQQTTNKSSDSSIDATTVEAIKTRETLAAPELGGARNALPLSENGTGSCSSENGVATSSSEKLVKIEVPPNKKMTSCTTSNDSYESNNNAQQILGLDLVRKSKMDNKEVHDDTSKQETYSDNSMKAGNSSFGKHDVMSLIGKLKELPIGAKYAKSQAAVSPPTLKHSDPIGRQSFTSDLVTQDKVKNTIPTEKHMKERNKMDTSIILQLMEKRTQTKSDATQTRANHLDAKENLTNEKVNECKDGSDPGNYSFAGKYKSNPKFAVTYKKASAEMNSSTVLLTEKERDRTILLVRFLQKCHTVNDLHRTFGGYGPISEVHFIPQQREGKFRDAYVIFKTKEGLQKALAKTVVSIKQEEVFLEAASCSTNTSNRVCPPSLIVDPDIPAALVKHPTRTVKVKELPHDIAAYHLKEALSVSGGRISGFFMGSSGSDAYIEFETEDAKEKAIAASPICISGRKLAILQTDAPRTTIIRISNVPENEKDMIRSICSLHGEVQKIRCRDTQIYDVHFKLAEWPNMVNILNSINGIVPWKQKWIAQPATVIPLEILNYLWSQPDGKKYLYSAIQDLCRKFNRSPLNIMELKDRVAQYCAEKA